MWLQKWEYKRGMGVYEPKKASFRALLLSHVLLLPVKLTDILFIYLLGHFMGKKNAVDSSSLESPNKQALNAIRTALMPEQKAQDWREFIVEQMIKVAVQDHLQETGEKIDNNEPVSELIYIGL